MNAVLRAVNPLDVNNSIIVNAHYSHKPGIICDIVLSLIHIYTDNLIYLVDSDYRVHQTIPTTSLILRFIIKN
jgi:hypothetical protein